MRITKIAMLTETTCGIWIDDVQRVVTDPVLVYEEGLKADMEIDEAFAVYLEQKAGIAKAKSRALDLLGIRDYCSAELENRLSEQFDRRIAAAAVQRMIELELVNDTVYATKYAKDLVVRRGLSLRRARSEMRQKGLENDRIDEALALYEDDELERVEAVVAKKYVKKLQMPNGRRNVIAALMRMGFRYSDIRTVLQNYALPEEDDEAEIEWMDEEP